jgi:hypothetical protein
VRTKLIPIRLSAEQMRCLCAEWPDLRNDHLPSRTVPCGARRHARVRATMHMARRLCSTTYRSCSTGSVPLAHQRRPSSKGLITGECGDRGHRGRRRRRSSGRGR